MKNERGHNIQLKLLMMQKTQRWLHGQLKDRGYTLTEQLLSRILNGRYTYKCAGEIITASELIIDECLHSGMNEAV